MKMSKDPGKKGWRWWPMDVTAIGLCLGLTALVYFTGVHPLLSRQVESAQRRNELKNQRDEASSLQTTLTLLKRELAQVEHTLSQSPLRLQPTSAMNQRLAQITELAARSGLKLNEIQPGKAVPGTHYDTVPLVLSGAGTYRTCASFLSEMHQSFPDMGVTAFSVGGDPTSGKSTAAFRFTLIWYAAPLDRAQK